MGNGVGLHFVVCPHVSVRPLSGYSVRAHDTVNFPIGHHVSAL